jgi:hypothetical protein
MDLTRKYLSLMEITSKTLIYRRSFAVARPRFGRKRRSAIRMINGHAC